MIINQLLLFFAGFGFGVISRCVYSAVARLEKAINLVPITIIFDILMTGIGVIAFSFMLFFINDGIFMPFIFVASIVGFIAASFFI